MKKKILSMVMAGALVFSVSSIAQAATINKDATSGKYAAPEITAEGEYEVPTIDVTLSDTSSKKVAINPYGLTASISDTTDATAMLVNKTETITNGSVVALAVNATVKATPAGKAALATAEVKDTDTKNSIFAYLQLDIGTTVKEDTAYNTKNANQVVFAAKETTKKAMVTLADKTDATNSKAAYKILGNVATNPTAMWTSDDKVSFSIVYDFEPRVIKTTTP